MRLVLLLIGAALVCPAQRLHVYSPFTRFDPSGEVAKPDRGQRPPRTILSPGVPRNAFSSLRIVVEMDQPGPYHLDIGQNPDNAVTATLYKEVLTLTPEGWLPDRLVKVAIPYAGTGADFHLPAAVPSQITASGSTAAQTQPIAKVATFWLDMWVDRNAPVDRVKVEPQLWVGALNDWVVYPMEVRIQSPVVPRIIPLTAASRGGRRGSSADTAVWGTVMNALCGRPDPVAEGTSGVLTPEGLLRRNALQHMALLPDKARLGTLFTKVTGMAAAQWCAAPTPFGAGPEWYLRFRDLIYREAGARD